MTPADSRRESAHRVGETLSEKSHEAELVELAAQREEHREPDERREHVAFVPMSSSVSTPDASRTPRPRNATAVESSPERRGRRPERHHADERDQHHLLVAA